MTDIICNTPESIMAFRLLARRERLFWKDQTMARLAKKYNAKSYVYDGIFVGIISNGYIFWHLKKNHMYISKTKIP